jgi:hypothetical protein
MDNYTFREYTDMHLILGEARGNGAAAVRLYAVTSTSQPTQVPRHLSSHQGDRYYSPLRPRSARTVDAEERILRRAEVNPRTTVRRI